MGEVCTSMNRLGESGRPVGIGEEPEEEVESQKFLDHVKTFFENLKTQNRLNFGLDPVESKSYKYECPMKNKLKNSSHDLSFTVSNIRIKSCVSHNKCKKSIFVSEISFTQKKFPIEINFGAVPVINGIFTLHQTFTVNELEN